MAYEQLKQRQSVVWRTGPYQRITETITDIHEAVIERLEPEPGMQWLDSRAAPAPSPSARRSAARP